MSVSTESIASPDRAGNKNSLCVCDLDALVSEAHLQAAFTGGSHSPPVSVMVIRDQLTHRSLGYGVVLFRSESDAVAAKEAAQPLFVGPNLCRIIGPFKDGTLTRPPPRPTGEGIFIKNLAPDVVAPELYQEFSPYGEILACRIVLSDYGQSRGMAYITYSSKEAALKAIDAVNGKTLHNRKLYVGPNLPRHERLHRYDDSKEEFTNIFVTGVASSVPEHDFYESFAKIGVVDAYSMPLDQFGQPRGFGFVNYKHHKDAVRAIEELDGKLVIGGKTLGVTRAQQKPPVDQNSSNSVHAHLHPGSDSYSQSTSAGTAKDDSAASCNLYIRHIDRIITDSELESAFAVYGPVISAKIMRDERGGSRGYGFVCFKDSESAQAAIKGMNGTVVWGQALYVALAQRRDRGLRRMRGPYNIPFAMGVPSVMPMVPSPYYYWGVNVHGAPIAIPAPGILPGQDGNTMASLQASMAQMQLAQPRAGSPSTAGSKEASDDGNSSRSSNNWNRSSQQSQSQSQSQSQHRAWSPNMSRKTRRQRDFQPSLAAAVASAENEAAEKQVVGEALYPKVLKHPAVDSPELASRLTGILLKQKTSEVLEWVDNDFLLAKIVYQALDALREYEATAPDL